MESSGRLAPMKKVYLASTVIAALVIGGFTASSSVASTADPEPITKGYATSILKQGKNVEPDFPGKIRSGAKEEKPLKPEESKPEETKTEAEKDLVEGIPAKPEESKPGVPQEDKPSSETPKPTQPSPTPTPKPTPPPAPEPAPAPKPTPPPCPSNPGGGGSAPGVTSPLGVGGTTTSDMQSFSAAYNAIRVANCLPPVPPANFRYDSCMEQRLFWMAEDPSTDPMSAWGHIGSQRSDGVPSVGCDGNLAGGSGNTGATVAQKWWDSSGHRSSLYKPTYTGSTAGVCILFAMTHGGVPNEPSSFTRAAARWVNC